MAARTEPNSNDTFGGYLRFLRRRARMTQTELSIAVGYSPGQISMLESGQRQPNVTAVMALFIAALGIQHDAQASNRLIELAHAAIVPSIAGPSIRVREQIEWHQEEIGALEEMPPLPSCFVQRIEPEERLAQWLKRERWAAICGLPGMGKSTLAAALANAYASQHPIFWLSFGNGTNQSPEEVLRQLALFALAHASPAIQTALLRRIAGGETPGPLRQQLFHIAAALHTLRSPLLVFDDAHLITGKEEIVEILLGVRSQAPYSRALYSTREVLNLPGLPHLMLHGLDHNEALNLVNAMRDSIFVPVGDKDSFNPIIAQTAGNPLLLRLAVAQLGQGEPDAFASLGQSVTNHLVAQVIEDLSGDTRWLLDWLVVWQSAIDLTDPALAAWLPDQRVVEPLPVQKSSQGEYGLWVEELRRKGIIDHDTHAYVHPLLRDPVLAALNVQPDRRHALHRVAAAWAEVQGDRIKAAHHHTLVGNLARACELLDSRDESSSPIQQSRASVHGATTVIDEILVRLHRQKASATLEKKPSEEQSRMSARLLALRGDLLINTLRADEARSNYRSAIDLTDTPTVRAQLAQRLAFSLLRIGHAQDALVLCEEALRTLAQLDSPEAPHLRLQLGGVLLRTLIAVGRLEDAAALCQEALAAARALRLTKPTAAEKICATAYHGLGYICRRQANNEQARIYFERACVHARNAGTQNEEAESLNYLSVTLRELGDFAGSELHGRRALAVAQSTGNDFLSATILHRLSIASYYHNELKLALERSEQAAALQRQMGDAGGIALCDSLQALVYTGIGNLPEAIRAIERARLESSLLDNNWLQGLVLYVYGIVHTMGANLLPAETALRAALGKDEYVRDLPMREGVLIFLGMNAVAQGNLEEAQRIEASLTANVAIEVELLSGLLRGMMAIASGDKTAACAIAEKIRRRAQESGYLIYASEATQLLAAVEKPPPLNTIVGFVCLQAHVRG